MLFLVFQKIFFWRLLGGKRAKNSPKWQKILPVALHIWGTMHHMTVTLVCKMIISSGIFFILFKILILLVHREIKGEKMVQNDKKFCLLHFISQESSIRRLSFMVQMCKMITSPGVFSILKFWFSGLSGGWKGKK